MSEDDRVFEDLLLARAGLFLVEAVLDMLEAFRRFGELLFFRVLSIRSFLEGEEGGGEEDDEGEGGEGEGGEDEGGEDEGDEGGAAFLEGDRPCAAPPRPASNPSDDPLDLDLMDITLMNLALLNLALLNLAFLEGRSLRHRSSFVLNEPARFVRIAYLSDTHPERHASAFRIAASGSQHQDRRFSLARHRPSVSPACRPRAS